MADSKISGFLSKDTAGLPNWAWILVVGAGIAAVYILPKFFPGASNQSSSSSTGAADTSGLGLAIDPTTGLPYAVEGLVPSGGTVGATGTGTVGGTGLPCPPLSTPAAPPTGMTYQQGTDSNGCPVWILVSSSGGSQFSVHYLGPPIPKPTQTTPAWPGGTQQIRMAG